MKKSLKVQLIDCLVETSFAKCLHDSRFLIVILLLYKMVCSSVRTSVDANLLTNDWQKENVKAVHLHNVYCVNEPCNTHIGILDGLIVDVVRKNSLFLLIGEQGDNWKKMQKKVDSQAFFYTHPGGPWHVLLLPGTHFLSFMCPVGTHGIFSPIHVNQS